MFQFILLKPILNKYVFKKYWSGSSEPTVTSDPLYSLYGKGKKKKNENLNFVFPIVKMHSQ